MPKEERFSIACAQRQERRTVLLETFEGVAEEWLRLQSKTLAPETTSNPALAAQEPDFASGAGTAKSRRRVAFDRAELVSVTRGR